MPGGPLPGPVGWSCIENPLHQGRKRYPFSKIPDQDVVVLFSSKILVLFLGQQRSTVLYVELDDIYNLPCSKPVEQFYSTGV